MTRRGWWALGIGCAGLAGLVACFVDVPDVLTDAAADSGSDDSNANRDTGAVSDSGGDVVIPTSSCDAGACGAPPGFQPVLFALDRNTACPGSTSSVDLVADPGQAPASACGCDCAIATQPSCVPLTFPHNIDQTANAQCNQVGTVPLAVDGGCNASPSIFLLASHWSIPALPPASPGSCTGNATPDPSKVPTTASRLCVDPTCKIACAPSSGFKQCFQAPGDVACPNAMTKHRAGLAAGVTCSACTGCKVGTDGGCQGTMTLYGDTMCAKALEAPIPVDGTCTSNDAGGSQAQAFKYAPAVSAFCTPGTSVPSAAPPVQAQTICCP